jgi:cytochrome c2
MVRGGGMCRMMDVTPQPVDPASLPEPSSSGAQVLKNKCTQCHGLVSPRQHASQDWPHIVGRMDRVMRMMAGGGMMMRSNIQPLTLEEKSTLLNYLQQNAFQAMKPANLPDSSVSEARAFTRICSQCHALPDPSAYSAEQWKDIVARMSGNMENMGFGRLAPDQKEAILGYLEKNALRQ